MDSILRFFGVSLVLFTGVLQPAYAQETPVLHSVTYIEALPSATEKTIDLLSDYVRAGRDADGNRAFLALQRIGRPNHFAIIETWTDAQAFETHTGSSNAERLSVDLDAALYSPPDQRAHQDLLIAESAAARPNATYVLTHVDVFPANTELAVEFLQTLATASRRDDGNLRFDVLVSDRRNHMTVVEVWESAGAQEAHLGEAHTQVFRKNLAPYSGALYDERLYRGL